MTSRRKFLTGSLAASAGIFGGGALFFRSKPFGALPEGDRLRRILASPHYIGGMFHPYEPMTRVAERSGSLWREWWKFLFSSKRELSPAKPLPQVRTKLTEVSADEDFSLWFGHSSVWVQNTGVKILVDPVFSPHASPLPFINKAYPAEFTWGASDFPEIDILSITHDHWDHLDYPTVVSLREKIRQVVCPLGVGAHFEHWGFSPEKIWEGDWGDTFEYRNAKITLLPGQHFSGRFLKSAQSQWCSYAFIFPNKRIFFSGDGGWGSHFAQIGAELGPFDLAFLENGQYDKAWPNVHMFPEDAANAALALRAKCIAPIHYGKFNLAKHRWNTPVKELARLSAGKPYKLLTPRIGQTLHPDLPTDQWWA